MKDKPIRVKLRYSTYTHVLLYNTKWKNWACSFQSFLYLSSFHIQPTSVPWLKLQCLPNHYWSTKVARASAHADRSVSVMTAACRWQPTAGPCVKSRRQLYMKYAGDLSPHDICYLQTTLHNTAHSVNSSGKAYTDHLYKNHRCEMFFFTVFSLLLCFPFIHHVCRRWSRPPVTRRNASWESCSVKDQRWLPWLTQKS